MKNFVYSANDAIQCVVELDFMTVLTVTIEWYLKDSDVAAHLSLQATLSSFIPLDIFKVAFRTLLISDHVALPDRIVFQNAELVKVEDDSFVAVSIIFLNYTKFFYH